MPDHAKMASDEIANSTPPFADRKDIIWNFHNDFECSHFCYQSVTHFGFLWYTQAPSIQVSFLVQTRFFY